jgi:YihY family inner membrane protein
VNPVELAIRKFDRAQQRTRPTAFICGVVKKYNDDNGGALAGNLAYSAFVSVFPLLLVLTTVLGLVAAVSPAFRQDAIDAVADQVPLIGQELTGSIGTLQRSSVIGLIVGFVALVWGAMRLARAALYTMSQVWNLPWPARPDFVPRLGRALLFLVLLGLVVIATTVLAAVSTWGNHALSFKLLAEAVTATVNAGMFFTGYRILTARGVPSRDLGPGAVVAGILWMGVQVAGTYLVHHYLHSDSVYGVFATVLGLMAWIFIAIEITVYCAEINVVLVRRLWPRTFMQPPLTEADRASLALQALQNQRRVEEHVTVTFDDRPPGTEASPYTPETPEQVFPPAPRPAGPELPEIPHPDPVEDAPLTESESESQPEPSET